MAVLLRLFAYIAGSTTALVIAAPAAKAERTDPKIAEEPRVEVDPLGSGLTIRGGESPGFVTFTFDDGPSATTTPAVLEALAKYEVPATFFVVGRRFSGSRGQAPANRKVLDDIVAAGHVIGNHTYNHDNLRRLGRKAVHAAIDRGQSAIERAIGSAPVVFRPPYGALSKTAGKHLHANGYTIVDWNIDPQDFLAAKRKTMRKRVLAMVLRRNGGVVLLHDTKRWTAKVLPGILDDLEAENCRRLATGEQPIVPVSLHYFMRDKAGHKRPVPPAIEARTQRYVEGLPRRCQARDQTIDKAEQAH